MAFIDLATWAATLPVLAAHLVVSVEICAGLLPGRRDGPPRERASADTVILIPAHDEADIIDGCLAGLTASLAPGMRILLVADNCRDDTAAIARARGVEVVERHDPERRGKGFALAFGRDHLHRRPPDAVIVLDADCYAGPADIAALAACAVGHDAPVQACDLLRPTKGSPLVEISTFAFAVKNQIRQQGLQRIGAAPMLAGTGMAFPWRIFASAPLATANQTEDLQLGLDLIRAGERPRFLAAACVWSDAGDATTTMAQRSRWEGGFLAIATRQALPILVGGVSGGSWTQLWSGLHLLTPPLALLGLVNLLLTPLLAGLVALGGATTPLIALLGAQLMLSLTLTAAWVRLGSAFLSPAAALRLPFYMLWKLPLYLHILTRRESGHWVRGARPRRND